MKQQLLDEYKESTATIEVEVTVTYSRKVQVTVPVDEDGYKSYLDVEDAVKGKIKSFPKKQGWELKKKDINYS